MESLLGKAMDNTGDNSGADNSAANMSPDDAHAQLTQATQQLSPDQFHAATTSAISSMPQTTQNALSQILQSAGAGQGAGVQSGAADANGISKMMHWVQTNVPGGIPAVLGTLGAAGAVGGVAAAANTGQGGNLLNSAESAGGGLLGSVLGTIMPAINNAVSKVGK